MAATECLIPNTKMSLVDESLGKQTLLENDTRQSVNSFKENDKHSLCLFLVRLVQLDALKLAGCLDNNISANCIIHTQAHALYQWLMQQQTIVTVLFLGCYNK